MQKFILILLSTSLICSCEYGRNDSESRISQLIKPDFNYQFQAFRCSIINDFTLNKVEELIPAFVNEVDQVASNDNILIVFPIMDGNLVSNIFEIWIKKKSSISLDNYNEIINNSFIDVSSCIKPNFVSNGLDMVVSNGNNFNPQGSYIELLECSYTEDGSFLTFNMSVDDLKFFMSQKDITYQSMYLENSSNNNFSWVNIFDSQAKYNDFAESTLDDTSFRIISDNFKDQSTCFRRDIFKGYKIN